MSVSFLPKLMADALTDLTPDMLMKRGVRLLMLDFDNTIVPYTSDKPTVLMASWLAGARVSGLQLCVVSNSKRGRVKKFCKEHDIPCITHARKPFSKGIRQCMERYGYKPEECALVGDQIFTDVLGANGCGVQSILVKAIDNHNIWLKLRHVAELPFIFLARKRRLTNA